MNQKIELLSPAGDSDAFKAAILAGANAIYFGLEKFSARTRATNLTLSQLEELAPLAKSRSVRLYLTLNTLVRDCEIGDALRLAETALERGVDAIIVQDFGLMAALRAHFPNAEIHASTQMTTHNLAQLDLLARAGVSQVNLSRELSIEQIKLFSEKLKIYGIVPEVFVHGAYCISYSGQCYLSGALYGQAGNRGDDQRVSRGEGHIIAAGEPTPHGLPQQNHRSQRGQRRHDITIVLQKKGLAVRVEQLLPVVFGPLGVHDLRRARHLDLLDAPDGRIQEAVAVNVCLHLL